MGCKLSVDEALENPASSIGCSFFCSDFPSPGLRLRQDDLEDGSHVLANCFPDDATKLSHQTGAVSRDHIM